MAEKRTTSPSQLHLERWKVLTQTYKVKDDQEQLILKQQKILQLHVDLINYVLKWNYTYS